MTNPNQGPKKGKPLVTKEGFFEFVSTHKWDSIAYLLLFIGLIVMFFHDVIGGLIVGVILGIYFSDNLKSRFEQLKEHVEHEGIFKSFVAVAAVIALFISTLGLCVGTVIGVLLRPLFGHLISSPFDKE